MKIFFILFRSNINIPKTIYFNLKMLPFKDAIKLPVYVFKNWKFVELNGTILIKAPIRRGMIHLGTNIAGFVLTPVGTLNMRRKSKIIFLGSTRISQGCQLFLNNKAQLIFHEKAVLGDNVKLFCFKRIEIGVQSEITWNSQITDYNSHFIENIDTGMIPNIYKPIKIGNFCWIGNRTTIMPGTVLPDRIIVASNSLLNKDYAEVGILKYSLIGGMPAKLLKTNVKRIYPKNEEVLLLNFFKKNDINSVHKSILEQSNYNLR